MDLNAWIYLFLGIFLVVTALVTFGVTIPVGVMTVVHVCGFVAGVLMLVYFFIALTK